MVTGIMDKNSELQQEFVIAYENLTKQYGLKIIGMPVFIPTNHGTFEIQIQLSVIPSETNSSLK